MVEMAEALPYSTGIFASTGRSLQVYNARVRSRASRRLSECPALPTMQPTVSSLMTSADRGDASAAEALFTALYSDLRRLAQYELSRRGGGITLTATALLHEAYLDMSKRDGAMFVDRGRFMAYASRVMRGLIIHYARNRRAQKRGGRFEMTTLETKLSTSSFSAGSRSRRSPVCGACRSAPFSASGTRRGSISTARCATFARWPDRPPP
jgi:RNA polymerase sigma factor (sigma-70 family)